MIISQINAEEITRTNEDRWNKLLLHSTNASYRQSMPCEYSCLENRRREVCSFIFQLDGEDIAGVHYVLKCSPGNIISTADMVSGFVFREEPKAEVLPFMLEHFMNWANERKASYARITPWLPKSIKSEETPYATWIPDVFKSAGFIPIKPGRHTYWIDLLMSEEELLARMGKKTRQNIRKPSRQSLETEIYEKPSTSLFESFWYLYKREHQERRKYLQTKQRIELGIIPMMESGLGGLYFSKYNGKMVYVIFASNFGQTAEIFVGTHQDVMEKKCPPPGLLLRWEIIRDLKRRGNKIYDLGYCPGPVPIEEHPMYGIWRFKHSFGGDHVEFLPTYGKVLRPLTGRLFQYLQYRS